MKFIIFVIDGPGNLAVADEMKQIDDFNESLQKNGNWVLAAGIAGPTTNSCLQRWMFLSDLSLELCLMN
jgi:hypothetical protein